MSTAIEFLTALMDAVVLRSRQPAGGEDWEKALDRVGAALETLLASRDTGGSEVGEGVRFSIQDDEVVFGAQPIWALRGWPWLERLHRRGIRTLRFGGPVRRSQLSSFVVDLEAGLAGEPIEAEAVRSARWGAIGLTFSQDRASGGGAPAVRTGERPLGGAERSDRESTPSNRAPKTPSPGSAPPPGSGAPDFPGNLEFEVMSWILSEVSAVRPLPLVECRALVRTLSVGIRSRHRRSLCLLASIRSDEYLATHSINTSLLAMLVAESSGQNSREVWQVGLAGLLHDIGMIQIPFELVDREDRLTEAERSILHNHPSVGARILLEGPSELGIPAVVAFEHHLRVDGGGYPQPPEQADGDVRPPHRISRLVHLVSVYDALRADRPYSPAWSHDRALTFIRSGMGGQFDAALSRQFLELFDGWVPARLQPSSGTGDSAGFGC